MITVFDTNFLRINPHSRSLYHCSIILLSFFSETRGRRLVGACIQQANCCPRSTTHDFARINSPSTLYQCPKSSTAAPPLCCKVKTSVCFVRLDFDIVCWQWKPFLQPLWKLGLPTWFLLGFDCGLSWRRHWWWLFSVHSGRMRFPHCAPDEVLLEQQTVLLIMVETTCTFRCFKKMNSSFFFGQ